MNFCFNHGKKNSGNKPMGGQVDEVED